MISRRSIRLSRRQAEAALSRDARSAAQSDGSVRRLHQLLSAAGDTRATTVDQDRQEAAVADFRARAASISATGPAPSRRAAVAKFLSSRMIALVIAGGVATGGVAYAASTGHLPGTASHSGSPAPSASGSIPSERPSPSRSNTTSDSGSTAHSSTTGSPSASLTATASSGVPDPSFAGLCNAYESGVAASKGKALSNPAFTALIDAAGGIDNVDAYCARLGITPKSTSTATASTATSTTASKSHGPVSTPPGQAKTHQNSAASPRSGKP